MTEVIGQPFVYEDGMSLCPHCYQVTFPTAPHTEVMCGNVQKHEAYAMAGGDIIIQKV